MCVLHQIFALILVISRSFGLHIVFVDLLLHHLVLLFLLLLLLTSSYTFPGKNHVCKFIGCGRNDKFNYVVMQLQVSHNVC